MLVTIRNLPGNTRYADLKSLIVSKCGLTEMILDNLTPDGNNTKKVTVGLAEEEDAAILMRKINGLLIEGHQVFVEAIKKKQGPAYGMNETGVMRQPLLQQPYYQQSNYQPSNYQPGYTGFQQNGAPAASHAEMYGVTTAQNAFANYGYPQQMQYQSNQMMAQPVTTFDEDAPLGFSNQGSNINVWANQNDWNPAGSASGGNRTSQQSRNNSRWDNSDDNNGRPRRDAPGRERERGRDYDGSSRNFGRDASSRDVGRKAPPRDLGRDAPSRDFGRDAQSRDFGRDAQSRGFGRDGPSRDRGRDAPRDQRRDAPQRERGSDRGRDVPARNVPARNAPTRNVPARNAPTRNAPARIAATRTAPARDANYSRSEFDRGPSKRQFSADNAPSKSSFSQMYKFSHQRDKPGQNRNTMQPKASPNMTRKAQGDYIPAVKRQRPNADQFDKQGSANNTQSLQSNNTNPQSQTLNKKKPKKNDPETLLNRASTWRSQIASAVARDMVKDPALKNDLDGPLFLTQLKRAIRHRLDTLFGNNIYIFQKDMLKLYREKYSVDTDADFFNEVTEDIKIHGAYNGDDITKAAPDGTKVGAGTDKNSPTDLQGAEAGNAETTKKIPSYPQGDKRLNKEFKKANVTIFRDTDSLVNRLKPNLKKAVDEEVEEMAALIAEEFQDEPEPQHENFHKRVKTTVTEEYRQMLKVNVAKRLLKIRPIMLRIFNKPKIINRSILAPILAEYGIDSLRKSEKKPIMYVGTCKTYEQLDKLCTMEPLVVDGSKILIRPFQLTGFNEKITRDQIKMHRKNICETYTNAPDDYSAEIEEQIAELDEDIGNENIDDQYQAQSENDQPDETQEPKEKKKEQEAGEEIETVENGNEVEQETCENDYPEEVESVDPDAEGNNGEQDTELDKENSTEVDSTGVLAVKSKENEQADSELNDESQKEENSFVIDGEPSETDNADPDKDISNNLEDSEDDGPKNYEDIDIDDINDDDLEDW